MLSIVLSKNVLTYLLEILYKLNKMVMKYSYKSVCFDEFIFYIYILLYLQIKLK